ncbi:DUF397 domain-containing protein [Streptomyces sp. ID05-04B]|uniref:DUF397 domain-containing protein n=1 Tax=unclassified Streptomyces TaxID=2593676 RepID=UPI000D1B5B74|nr:MULTISPECIES: DUF397 domain-containing protein [unclassified Streptomyces]AVV42417.1 DUF397 domain-containing protein [Streptomyces sp. P3]MDX5566459.1 DUF397 domain-containing protein [Streptomyces sp. ID05-04B]
MTSLSPPEWFKSSHSGGSGTECVECMRGESGTLVRDSKQTGGPVIAVQPHAWGSFVAALRCGTLEDR